MKALLFLMVAFATTVLSGTAFVDAISPEQAIDSVFVIETFDGTGAGVAISPTKVLTAQHVVGNATEVKVRNNSSSSKGKVIARDEQSDLALISVDGADYTPLTVAQETPHLGRQVFAIGAPSGNLSITRGIVSSFRETNGIQYVQTDAAVNPGNSGGPLIDDDGVIVGIVVLKSSDQEGVGLAVTPAVIQRFLTATPQNAGTGQQASSDLPNDEKTSSKSNDLPIEILAATLVIVILGIILIRRHRNRPVDVKLGRILPPETGEIDGNN